MMDAVIDGMVQFLSGQPDPLLDAGRLGDRIPAGADDVPAVAISLAIESTRGTGLGRFRKEGHQLLSNTSVIKVEADPNTFSPDLKSLQLAPLPMRRNPASSTPGFGPADVQVTRVTGPDQPVSYRAAAQPAAVNEFEIDPLRARLIFGAPQPAGEQLQVTFWTVQFRDDVTGGRCEGTINLDLWSGSVADASALSRKLQTKVRADETALRQCGFALLAPSAMCAAESLAYQPGSGSAFPVWKQRLTYRFLFDWEQAGAVSSGGPIRTVNIGMEGSVNEAFPIPPGS